MLLMLVNMKKILSVASEKEQDPVEQSENTTVIDNMSKTSM